MYLPRLITKRLLGLSAVFPAIVVSGARQVGKSTLLQHVFKNKAEFVVFDASLDIENARRDPELFLNNHRTPLVLDEIQYAPELVSAIKRSIDRDRSPGRFILTGSQQWGVLSSIAESLAGRAVFIDLEGFCLAEIIQSGSDSWIASWMENPEAFLQRRPARIKADRTLFEQLWRGWLPEAQFLPLETIPDFYAAYIRTYIERDVRLLADVADVQLFGRFLRLVAALTGQEINYSRLGREIGLTPKTAHRWLGMLQATFQWFSIPAYSGNTVKRISSAPKGYIADTGLACAAQAVSSPRAIGGNPLWGALFETAVAGEIRKQCSMLSPRPNIYHWRSHGGAEVDIILERDGVYYPVEIKAASNPTRRDAGGIGAFRKTYPRLHIEKGLVIAPAGQVLPLSEHDVVMPWDVGG